MSDHDSADIGGRNAAPANEAQRDRAVGRMYDDGQDAETRLRWAELAIAASRRRGVTSGIDAARTLADEVNVRAYAIREFGVVPGDTIRDAADLCETVFRGIGRRTTRSARSCRHGWR
ncbi:hypothetical protein [Streptomyces sp. NPDC004286]|uniref:hypothetical protein n=1 Tax=Streptomyces sp. NPDC004286 TaxID=3364696 RepID=UPI0036CE2A25